MIFQHAGAAPQGLLISSTIFLNSWPAGLYPDVITRVKFQVDWSNGLEATAYGCLKSGALVLPMIVALTTVLRTTALP